MSKFRKRPILIDAYQWIETAPAYPIPPVPHTHLRERRPWFFDPYWEVRTPEGWVRISHLSWAVRGVEGEWYPVKDSIFRKTFEPVEEEDST